MAYDNNHRPDQNRGQNFGFINPAPRRRRERRWDNRNHRWFWAWVR
ncbi:hypothetical protein [Gordonia neofelifaecis]|uniref:Uncharacterized protein n=1 Tax=Gordonia neofelifaecis NRRL B-59395 TaxID=644548 RepID=F1YI12_9ACTN|nr:hypothetical protein [Gordonia neofelifaecis]EGD55566.1 hypothetical protein SCNU_07633 [Gordonia neofelifaecis NRRL B-59395]